jgi:hypothetical protein
MVMLVESVVGVIDMIFGGESISEKSTVKNRIADAGDPAVYVDGHSDCTANSRLLSLHGCREKGAMAA